MPEHRYRQYCGLARALDVAGDRWSLLVVRELILGPRRFTDLVDGLPGISRKVLTERLRELERHGVVSRTELPPPAARHVYELTDDGRDLAAAMVPLIGWGAKRLGDREAGESFHPRWAAIGMAMLADREATRGVSETYEYRVGDSAFHFRVEDGTIEAHDGPAPDPDAVVTTDERTFADLASGRTTGASARAKGALSISGDRQAARRLRTIFSRSRVLGRAQAVATAHREDL